jgi:hypothetical protein
MKTQQVSQQKNGKQEEKNDNRGQCNKYIVI